MKDECARYGEELTSYASGELATIERSAVAAHLDACPACRRELESELAMRRDLTGLPAAGCPAEVGQRVLAAVARERRAARRRWWTAGAGATLAAAALAGVLLLRPGAPAETTSGTVAGGEPVEIYTPDQIAVARRDLIQTMTLTARVLDQAGRGTFADVFNERLPAAVAGSLRPLNDSTRGG